MFYVYSGFHGNFNIHAVTDNEELAAKFCATKNSEVTHKYEKNYDYKKVEKLEDIFESNTNCDDIGCYSNIEVYIEDGKYRFNIINKIISMELDSDINKDNMMKFYMTKISDDDRCNVYKVNVLNFFTKSTDEDIIIKSFADYWYEMIKDTGCINMDVWNNKVIEMYGCDYKNYISVRVDLNNLKNLLSKKKYDFTLCREFKSVGFNGYHPDIIIESVPPKCNKHVPYMGYYDNDGVMIENIEVGDNYECLYSKDMARIYLEDVVKKHYDKFYSIVSEI